MPQPRHRAASLLVALLVPACSDAGGSDPAPSPVVTRDSAGITIVENGAPGGVPEWSLSEPTLDIGSPDAEGPGLLFEVAAARTLPDGRVAVVNAGTGEIRFFEPDGSFLGSIGRKGEGPGEFSEPAGLWPIAGDSLMVWDSRLRRLTVFAQDGTFGRVKRLEGEVSNPTLVTAFEDGTLLVSDERFGEMPSDGYVPVPYTLARYRPDGTVADSLAGGIRWELGMWEVGAGDVRFGTRLFGSIAMVAGDEGGYWVAPGEHYEIVRHEPGGKVVRIVRWAGPERTVTEADVEADLRGELDDAPETAHERIRRYHADRDVAELFPPYGPVVSTADGGAWVMQYPRPAADTAPSWLVFDPGGRLTATIRLPGSVRPLEIGTDHVLAVETDDLDVEHLRRFGLRRSAPPPPSDGPSG